MWPEQHHAPIRSPQYGNRVVFDTAFYRLSNPQLALVGGAMSLVMTRQPAALNGA